jgi:hypothetical protein
MLFMFSVRLQKIRRAGDEKAATAACRTLDAPDGLGGGLPRAGWGMMLAARC